MADFPRGGGSSLTPLEAQRIKDSAMQDVLFGVSINNHITQNRKFIGTLTIAITFPYNSF